jgi:hypothetical protein
MESGLPVTALTSKEECPCAQGRNGKAIEANQIAVAIIRHSFEGHQVRRQDGEGCFARRSRDAFGRYVTDDE